MYSNSIYVVTSSGIQKHTYNNAPSFHEAWLEFSHSDDAAFESFEDAMIFSIQCLSDRLASLESKAVK